MALSPGNNSVRDQERRGLGHREFKGAKNRLCWKLLWRVGEEKGTGLTPMIANLSSGSRAGQAQRECGVDCSVTDSSLLCLVAKCVRCSTRRRVRRIETALA